MMTLLLAVVGVMFGPETSPGDISTMQKRESIVVRDEPLGKRIINTRQDKIERTRKDRQTY